MSSVSVTSSSKLEKATSELMQEIDAIRSLNSSLDTYLEHIRNFRRDLVAMDDNYKNLAKVNSDWLELLNKK